MCVHLIMTKVISILSLSSSKTTGSRHTRSQDTASYWSMRREASASLMRQSVIYVHGLNAAIIHEHKPFMFCRASCSIRLGSKVPCAKKIYIARGMSLLENSSSMYICTYWIHAASSLSGLTVSHSICTDLHRVSTDGQHE